MKRTTTLASILISTCALAQSLPQAFVEPLLGSDLIRNTEQYVLTEMAADPTASTWNIYERTINNFHPTLNTRTELRISRMENDIWVDRQHVKDSLILNQDQTNISTIYTYNLFNIPGYYFLTKSRSIYTNDALIKKPKEILVQYTTSPTSNIYASSYKKIYTYNAAGLVTREQHYSYSKQDTSNDYHIYNNDNLLMASYSLSSTGDSITKQLFSYTQDKKLSSYITLLFDQDLAEWITYSADSITYNEQGKPASSTRYSTFSTTSEKPSFQALLKEYYTYNIEGQLLEEIQHTRNNNNWVFANKTVWTYANGKPTLGYFYRSYDGTTWFEFPSIRYTFNQNTSTKEVTEVFQSANVYPNPANQQLTVECGISPLKISLLDSKGQIVFTQLAAGITTFQTHTLPNGVYLLMLQNETQVSTQKIIINHY